MYRSATQPATWRGQTACFLGALLILSPTACSDDGSRGDNNNQLERCDSGQQRGCDCGEGYEGVERCLGGLWDECDCGDIFDGVWRNYHNSHEIDYAFVEDGWFYLYWYDDLGNSDVRCERGWEAPIVGATIEVGQTTYLLELNAAGDQLVVRSSDDYFSYDSYDWWSDTLSSPCDCSHAQDGAMCAE